MPQKNRSKFIKPVFTSNVVKANWDNSVSACRNMARLGLALEGNQALDDSKKTRESKVSATQFLGMSPMRLPIMLSSCFSIIIPLWPCFYPPSDVCLIPLLCIPTYHHDICGQLYLRVMTLVLLIGTLKDESCQKKIRSMWQTSYPHMAMIIM